MAKFFNIEGEQLARINRLYQRQVDGEYIILGQANGFTDIAQWSEKYMNIHIVTVRSENLRLEYRMPDR